MTNDPHPGDDTTWVPAPSPAPSPAAGGPAPASDPFGTHLPPVTPASPVPAAPVRSKGGGAGLLVNVLLGVALVVAVGGVAFAVGRATAPAAVATNGRFGNGGNGGGQFFGPNASGAPDRNGGGFAGGFGGGGLTIEGTVTAVSADSITLQLASGQTVTIPIDAQTTYHSQAAATKDDVTSGAKVQVQLQGGRGGFVGNGGGNGGNGGPGASGQPTRTLPAAGSITLVPAGS